MIQLTKGVHFMYTITKFKWISMILLICILMACQYKKPNDPEKSSQLTVSLQMNNGSQMNGLIPRILPSKSFKRSAGETPESPSSPESIEDVQIVFYHFDMTVDELFDSFTEHNDDLEELLDSWEGDIYDFEAFWIGLTKAMFDIVAPGKYNIEKQDQLEIDDHHATGEFELNDGVKYSILGLTGHDELQYIGESYDWETESIFFNLEPGEEKEITIYLTYIDVGEYTSYEPDAYFTVTPESGTTETEFSFDASNSSDFEDPVSSLQVRWDWENDGNWETNYSTTKTATHQYGAAGTYTVHLLSLIHI